MNQVDLRLRLAGELAQRKELLTEKRALVGLDGFIDKIVRLVDQRFGEGHNDFTPIETIAEFGTRVFSASGKSTNIEMVEERQKIGGNGPIMANALYNAGCQVRFIGAIGIKGMNNHVFDEFAAKTHAFSISEPGITTAAEFKDGKIMFNSVTGLEGVSYQSIIDAVGYDCFFDIFNHADMIALVNWTMIPHMTSIFNEIIEKILLAHDTYHLCSRHLSNVGGQARTPDNKRQFFFDLADPAKRLGTDLANVVHTIERFETHGAVTLGLNFSEAKQVAKVLGHHILDESEDALKAAATFIRCNMGISCVVIHPVASAACSTPEGAFWVEGAWCAEPKITTGAGDHFNAGFMSARLLDLDPVSCLLLAVAFSGSYVRTTQSPTMDEAITFLRFWPEK